MAVEEHRNVWCEQVEQRNTGGELVDEETIVVRDLVREDQRSDQMELAKDCAEDVESTENISRDYRVARDADGQGSYKNDRQTSVSYRCYKTRREIRCCFGGIVPFRASSKQCRESQ